MWYKTIRNDKMYCGEIKVNINIFHQLNLK